jgi:signal transduction histidine kinase
MNAAVRRAGRGRRTAPSWRRDLLLPLVVGAVQVAGTFLTAGRLQYHLAGGTGTGGVRLQGHLDVLGLVLHQPGHLTALDWALVAIGPAALLARRRHPVAALWLAFTAALAPSPLWFGYLSMVVAFFGAATSGHRRAAWTPIAAGYVTSLWLAPLAWGGPLASASTALFVAAWLAVLLTAAEAVRMRQERRAAAAAASELDAKNRASEERLRMARELHDVIGHTISLINIQAGVGLDLMSTQPEQARAALAAVKTVSRQALGELRAMLCTLREEGEAAPRDPAPGLGRLPELISRTSAAGLAVSTDITGRPRRLPAAVDLAAYRIVQESLTNVARHAGPTAVTVRVAYGEHDLSIEVADDGRLVDNNGHGTQGTAGNGISGMRERAAALGGHLDAGPRPDRGFQVRALLPLTADHAGSTT